MSSKDFHAVSIVVPIYNAEKYLVKCLDSIVGQTFEDYEVLLINDGSTDGSQKIIDLYTEQYSDKFRAFSKENGGLSNTRNFSFSHLNGKYLTFLDSDDYLKEDYLEILYRAACEGNRDMVVSGQYKVSEDGKILDTISYPVDEKGQCVLRKLNIAGKMYKRDYVEKYHIRFAEGKIYEDNAFKLTALFLAKNIIFLDYCGYHQVVHQGSITSKKIEESRLPLKEIKDSVEFVLSNRDEINDYDIFEFTFLSFLTYFIFQANKGHAYMNLENRKSDFSIVEHLCDYAINILNKDFPSYWKNKHIGIFKKNKLVLKQKLGVKAFVFLCRTKTLKTFARFYYSI